MIKDNAIADIQQDNNPQPEKRKRNSLLIESALNRAIADGFTPYDSKNANAPGSAVAETSRRLDIPPKMIASAIDAQQIGQDASLYNPKDPHKKYLESLREAGVEVLTDARARLQLRRYTDENAKLKRILKEIERDNLTTGEIREKIYHLPTVKPENPTWLIESKLRPNSPGVPMLFCSDWHYGEKVSAKEMSGMNGFGLESADGRIRTLVEESINFAKKCQANPDYPGIVVCLGGDFFSGDNLHPELTDTNEQKTIALFPRLQGRMIWMLEKLADEFGQVYVPCAFGNHGRNEQKPRFKLRAETSYEYLLYTQLEFYFQNNPRYKDKVHFNISTESGVHFTVGEHRYYLTHGDALGVKGGDGIIGAMGPIKRGAIKTGASEASRGKPYDTIIMGHWHQYIPMPGVIVNGTLKGWDEYARLQLRAPYDPPSQALWFNHPKYGPVTHHKIILDKHMPLPGADKPTGPVLPLKKRSAKGWSQPKAA